MLAIDGNQQIVGANRVARKSLLLDDRGLRSGVSLWTIFERDLDLFRRRDRSDISAQLVLAGCNESRPALVTPPDQNISASSNPANIKLHTRPRLDLVDSLLKLTPASQAHGGLSAGALRYRLALAGVERIATNMRWCEGPVYFGDARCLLWSDIPNNRIMRWDEETGLVSVFRRPSNNANGNTHDRQGRLVTCEHDSRRVSRTEYDGTVTVLIDKFDGKPLNSPNDVVVKSDDFGLVYRSAVRHSRQLRGSRRDPRAADQRLPPR